jgi:hypothetical protein
LRDFAAADIGQAYRPGYEAGRAGALLALATDVTVSPLNMRYVPGGRASLHDVSRLSARQVRGDHRILVIRIVDSTRAGPAWIGAQNQMEYPFPLADALGYKFEYAWSSNPRPAEFRTTELCT